MPKRNALVLVMPLVSVASTLHAQLPMPPAGEYACTQSEMAPSPVSSPGLPPATAIVTGASAFGNLVIERGGTYRLTSDRSRRSAWRWNAARGGVSFDGVLAAFANTYGVRGKLAFFDFSSRAIAFSCSMATSVDYGAVQSARTAIGGAPVQAPARSPLQGTLYFTERNGLAKLNLADGAQTLLTRNFQFDVRGSEVVVIDAKGSVLLTNEDGMGSRTVPVFGTSNEAPRFSPDGQRIAVMGNQRPTSMESAMLGATSGATLEPLVVDRNGRVLTAFGSQYVQPAWTPDGRIVVAGAKATGSYAGNAETGIFVSGTRGASLRRIDPGFDAPHGPAVSPDGAQVAFVNGARIWVMPLAGSAQPRKLFEGTGARLGSLTWSPDSRAVMFIEDNAVKVVQLDGGRVLPVQDRDGNPLRSTGTLVWR